MEMQSVSSSNIAAIGYDEENELLHVEFTSGKTYKYQGVSEEEYSSMMSASSIGSYFYHNIRNNYSGTEI